MGHPPSDPGGQNHGQGGGNQVKPGQTSAGGAQAVGGTVPGVVLGSTFTRKLKRKYSRYPY